jgi:hypothetical protein
MSTRRAAAATAAVLALALAGCGSGADERVRATPTAGVPGTCEYPDDVAHAAPDARRPLLGVATDLRFYAGERAELCRRLALARRTGATFVREDLDWDTAEPQPGRIAFDRFDAIVDAAARAGLAVLPILGRPPQWAATGGELPSDPAAYGRFVAAAARRYGPGGTFWRARPGLPRRPAPAFELLNEPYIAAPDRPAPDPVAYARVARAGVDAGHAAAAGARFLIAGETTWLDASGAEHPWIEPLLDADPALARDADGVAVHPYGPGPPGDESDRERRMQVARLEDVRRAVAERGGIGTPLWITELGWPTCPADDSGRCVSDAEQAANLRAALDLVHGRWSSAVEAFVVFSLIDVGDDTGDPEANFGLFRRDGGAKPALAVVRASG